jgi:putative ABC transport system substrate-binding protein
MQRRQFIAGLFGAAFARPLAAQGQTAKTPTIGILNLENSEPLWTSLQEGLRDIGYKSKENIQFEFRSADGNLDRLRTQAAELVSLKVDVIVPYPSPAIAVARQVTREIPIVMLGAGDPVGTGLVVSLTRPGGNITGTSSTTSELGAKTLEVVREMLPSMRRVTVLANANDPFTKPFLEQMRIGGEALRLDMQTVMIRAPDELEPAFAGMKESRADVVMVQPSLPRKRVADLALQHHMPAIAPTGGFAMLGGLMAYSPNQKEMARSTAVTIDKILKGRSPADLPIEQPTKFELIINLKTAKAIGIEVPPSLLARADQVIE